MGKTASAAKKIASSDTVFVNVEAHGTAFSALYFWILPAVFLGALIGVSQTEAAIPRILKRFQVDLDRLLSPAELNLSDASLDDIRLALPSSIRTLNDRCLSDDQRRIYHGGVYSWQPSKWQPKDSIPSTLSTSRSVNATYSYRDLSGYRSLLKRCRTQDILPYVVVVIGLLSGVMISSYVPPEGFIDCRRISEVLICLAWIISALLDILLIYLFPLKSSNGDWLFWMTLFKDLLMTIATAGGVVVTVVGVFNRCSCYTNWGRIGLALPQRADLAELLMYRLDRVYPAIVFISIGIELVIIPLFICIRYRYALRVFIQRDDRTSNAVWLWKIHRKWLSLRRKLQYGFRRQALLRSMTSGERGLRTTEPLELQRLTHPHRVSADGADAQEPTISLHEDPIHTNTGGLNPAVGSGVEDFASRGPRRRDTPQEHNPNLSRQSQGNQMPNRKPLPAHTPIIYLQPRP